MSGKQLDCCRLAEATSPEAQDEAMFGVTDDGAGEPAAALAQSHAAKHADSDAEMGEIVSLMLACQQPSHFFF